MRFVSYFTLTPTFCFHFCVEVLLQFKMLRILVVCDLTFPAGLWLADIFPLWCGCVSIYSLSVHSDSSEVVPAFFFLIEVYSRASDAGQV